MLKVTGFDQMIQSLERKKRGLTDFKKAFEEMYNEYIKEASANFVMEGRPSRWKSLSPAYKRRKDRLFPGRKILVRKGYTRESMFTGADHIKNISALKAEFGTKHPLAVIHQYQRDNPRPVIQYPEAIYRKYNDIMSLHIRSL